MKNRIARGFLVVVGMAALLLLSAGLCNRWVYAEGMAFTMGNDTDGRSRPEVRIVPKAPGDGLDTGPWPLFHGDLMHTGRSLYLGPQQEPVLKWKFQVGGVIRSSPAVGSDGTVYIPSLDGYLYAIRPDGSEKWRYQTGGQIYSAPAIARDGTVYFGSYDNYLHAVNPDGTLKWRYLTGGYIVFSSPSIASDGTVYVGSWDNYVYAFHPDGTLKWRYQTQHWVASSPAVGVDGIVYVGSYDGYLRAIYPDGSLKWQCSLGNCAFGPPAIAPNGTIYMGGYHSLFAVSPEGGILWEYLTGNEVQACPAIGSDGTIYVGSFDNHLYAFNPDGTLKWRYQTGYYVSSSPALGSDDTVYFGSWDNYVYALAPDGALKWRYKTNSYVHDSPGIGSDGTVYIGSEDNYLYALTPRPGSVKVTITPAAAAQAGGQWKVDNRGWNNSEVEETGLSVGTHTISFSDLAGWERPSARTVTVQEGQSLSLTEAYVRQKGSLRVSLIPQEAVAEGAAWQMDEDGTWRSSGVTVANVDVDTHGVRFRDIPGWITPDPQSPVIVKDQTTAAEATYRILGTLSVGPETGLSASGNPGGPFTPASLIYNIENIGHTGINWAATKTKYWIGLNPPSGRLEPGETAQVEVSITEDAMDLQLGSYAGIVIFNNLTTTYGTTSRPVQLSVVKPASSITARLSSPSLIIGEPLSISGEITPPPCQSGAFVSIRMESPSGSVKSHTVLANEAGSFSYGFACEDITTSGNWRMSTSWGGDTCLAGAASGLQPVTVSLGSSLISIDAGSRAVKLGDSVDLTGKFTPVPDCGRNLRDLPAAYLIVGPDGSRIMKNVVVNDPYGHFSLRGYTGFETLGGWTAQALFLGNEAYGYSSSEVLTIQVVETAGYAVIVEGKVATEEGITSHNKTANFVYRQLKQRGLLDEDILYFNYDVTQSGVDGVPSRIAMEQALTVWARDTMNHKPANLYIILVDHGATEEFYIDPEVITATDLASWLSTLQSGLTGQAAVQEIVTLLGFCRSGSFLEPLHGPYRVNIASAAADESSYKGPLDPSEGALGVRDGEFFITEFFKSAAVGKDLQKCFAEAGEKTRMFTSKGNGEPNGPYSDDSRQHPLLDDNGDGLGSNMPPGDAGLDGHLSKGLSIGVSSVTGNAPGDVQVTETIGTRFLGQETASVTLWAKVSDGHRMRSLWVEVKPPDFAPDDGGTGQVEMDLPTHVYDFYDEANGAYRWTDLGGFTNPGTYQIFFFARDDLTGNESSIKETVVYKAKQQNQSPGCFDLVSPVQGARVRTALGFEWTESTDPNGDPVTYTLEISKNESFVALDYKAERLAGVNAFVDLEDGLKDLTTYYWRVFAIDPYGASTASSQVWSFITDNTNAAKGYISGKVMDAVTNSGIGTAMVTVGSLPYFTTHLLGNYGEDLEKGTYKVKAEALGYTARTITGIVIREDKETSLDFALQPENPSSIAVVSPNGSEVWALGTQHTIRWIFDGAPGALVKLLLLSQGSVVRTLEASTPIGSSGSGSYAWTVNENLSPGATYRIKVVSTSHTIYSDQSNANFTLVNGIRVELSDTEAPAGGIARVPVEMGSVSGLENADLMVSYDPAALTALRVEPGSFGSSFAMESNLSTPGQVHVAMATGMAKTGSGRLLTLEFQVKGASGSSTDLSLGSTSLNGGALPVVKTNGRVSVVDSQILSGTVSYYGNGEPVQGVSMGLAGTYSLTAPTDASGSYSIHAISGRNYTLTPSKRDEVGLSISSYDASQVLKAVVDLVTLSSYERLAADVNGTGIVSAQDASEILKYVVGIVSLPFNGAPGIWVFDPAQLSSDNLGANQSGQDFKGIILGDVTHNWSRAMRPIPGPGAGSSSDARRVSFSWLHDDDLGWKPPANLHAVGGRPASLEGRMRITTGKPVQQRGTVFSIPVKVKILEGGIQSGELVLEYPSALFQAVFVTPEPGARGCMVASNLKIPGKIRIALSGPVPLRESGKLLKVTLKAGDGHYGRAAPGKGIAPRLVFRDVFFNDGAMACLVEGAGGTEEATSEDKKDRRWKGPGHYPGAIPGRIGYSGLTPPLVRGEKPFRGRENGEEAGRRLSASAGPQRTVSPGSPVVLSGVNSLVPEQSEVTYRWRQVDGPEVAVQDFQSPAARLMAPQVVRDAASLSFGLTLTSEDGTRSRDECIVNVTWQCLPPMADAGRSQSAREKGLVVLDGSGSKDSEGGTLRYSWKQTAGPLVEFSNPEWVRPSFVAPWVDSEGCALQFELTVTSRAGLRSRDECIVNVIRLKRPPVARVGENQVVEPGEVVVLDASASTDEDDDISFFQWTQLSGRPVVLSNPSGPTATFTAANAEGSGERGEIREDLTPLIFRVTVTDRVGLMDSARVEVRVRAMK